MAASHWAGLGSNRGLQVVCAVLRSIRKAARCLLCVLPVAQLWAEDILESGEKLCAPLENSRRENQYELDRNLAARLGLTLTSLPVGCVAQYTGFAEAFFTFRMPVFTNVFCTLRPQRSSPKLRSECGKLGRN